MKGERPATREDYDPPMDPPEGETVIEDSPPDPVPEAVRSARLTHAHTPPEGYLGGHDYSQRMLADEVQVRAFWAGLRQVVREEVRHVLDRGAPDLPLAHVAGTGGAAHACYCPIGGNHP